MKKESRNKYLFKNTIIFSIGNFGTKIITFLLVPLYTNVLTTSEYGTVDLMTVLTTVLVPIITMNISEAVMRFSMDKETNKENILNIAGVTIIISTVISLLLIPLFKAFETTSEYAVLLSLYILTYGASTIFLFYIRGIENLVEYSIMSIIQTAIIAILNIIFLVKLKMGINGYILSYTIAYSVTLLLCLLKNNIKINLHRFYIDKILLKKMLKYSVLLIPNSLMWWIMNSLDRVMVSSMISVSANGIYAVSYKIPSILITISNIFNQAWMYSAVREKDSEDKSEYTTNVFNALSVCIITVTIFLLLILKPFLKLYVDKNYYDAWKYVSPLLVGSVFLTLSSFIANEYTAHKDSKGFLFSSTVGAIGNLVLNYLLIPRIGILGAAIATCISYIMVYIYRVFDTKKYIRIKYLSNKNILNILILLIGSFIVYINGIVSYIILTILLAIFICVNFEFWKIVVTGIKNKISYMIMNLKNRKAGEN